jgi:uncharacterized cupin superfamily protein
MTSSSAGTHLRHDNAASVELPAPQPKPTSLTGQTEATLNLWSDDSTNAGVWECGPGEFTADRSNETEVCHIITGSGTVVGEDGVRADICPGSLLVLPRGWRGTWHVTETIRKTYITVGG